MATKRSADQLMQERLNRESCENCHFYGAIAGDQEGGMCLRFPPSITMEDGEPTTWRPFVLQGEWCGEFKRKTQG